MGTVVNPSQKFFLYARKSTDVEDKQILSIEAQLAELREFAKRESLFIVEELVEKQSAKIPGRPVFNSMMERIEHCEASGILAWHPDRLARNSVDGGKLIYLVDTGTITALKFPQFWFEATPQGKFMLQIAFGQSKYFVDSLSENTKRGLRQKVRRGEYPGMAPIGYLNDVRTKTIAIDRKKAPVIRQFFTLFATGKYTLQSMAHFLAQHGITSHSGKLLKNRIPWILKNPFYYGHFRYAGEIHEGIHEPLIAKKLFDAVQGVLTRRLKHYKRNEVPKAFTGLLRCGECGMMITAEIQKGHIYYRCSKKRKGYTCFQPFTREEDLDRQVSSLMQTVSLPQEWAAKMLEKLAAEEKDTAHSCLAFVAEKQTSKRAIDEKLERLLDSYLEQDIDRDEYRQRKADLMSEKKTIEESIARLQQTQTSWLEPMRSWINDASGVPTVASGSDLFAKKALAQKIFGSNLTLTDKKARGSALDLWAALRAAPTSRDWVPRVGVEPTRSVSLHGLLRPACIPVSPPRR